MCHRDKSLHNLRLCKGIERRRASEAIARRRSRDDRVQFRRALDHLAKGDVLMVTRLDRLARSTRDLLNTLATITGKPGCSWKKPRARSINCGSSATFVFAARAAGKSAIYGNFLPLANARRIWFLRAL